MSSSEPTEMKTLRVQRYGDPAEVLQADIVPVPSPGAAQIRIRVHACAFNPADWAVCQGFIPLPPPRGIGFDVSGAVDAIGEGVAGVSIGDLVFGVPDYIGYPTAGASEFAVLKVWYPVPNGLSLEHAACLPMAVETATRIGPHATPFAVDTASGTETAPGLKDPERLRAFFAALAQMPTDAPAEIGSPA